MHAPEELYTSDFVRSLFKEMSATYGLVNMVSSFGFCHRWRKQCLALVGAQAGETVVDLMSGMGELWPGLAAATENGGELIGLDFSKEMCARGKELIERRSFRRASILLEDVLDNTIPAACADVVVSSFGLKTFSQHQLSHIAAEVARILKPGGRFAMLEISVTPYAVLRVPYMFYLEKIIPLFGWIMLGNPDNYRLLGVYTKAFRDCTRAAELFRRAGLEVKQTSFFAGCATAVSGTKPAMPAD